MSTSRSTLAYFGVVFATGLLLGMIRVPLLVPRLGERNAELLEAPFMFVAILLAARWIGNRFQGDRRDLLKVGCGAAAFVLLADLAVGMLLRGMSAIGVFVDRDPVAGMAYYLLVAIFALAPRWFARSGRP